MELIELDERILKSKLKGLDSCFEEVRSVRDWAIAELEEKKLALRNFTNPTGFFKYLKSHKNQQLDYHKVLKYPSVGAINAFVIMIDREISLIQNQHEVVCDELFKQKKDLKQRIAQVDQSEMIMNILNFKQMEIKYIFEEKMKSLNMQKQRIINSSKDNSSLLNVYKKMEEIKANYDSMSQSIRDQKLKQYEMAVNILDEELGRVKNNLERLKLLVEAEKENSSPSQIDLIDRTACSLLGSLVKDVEECEACRSKDLKSVLNQDKFLSKATEYYKTLFKQVLNQFPFIGLCNVLYN